MEKKIKATRFSGAEWADQLHEIILVGVGGIGSWLALNLARIGHTLHLVDHDSVDESNVEGGQMYQRSDIDKSKVEAIIRTCRAFGATGVMEGHKQKYDASLGTTDIMITGLDNMDARKQVYQAWKAHVESKLTVNERIKCLLIDGRLTMEMYEVLAIQGDKPEQMARYERDYLFSSEEANKLECTAKQSTFGAMGISEAITATLCNWLTNQKLKFEMREVPFYQRKFCPIMDYKKLEAGD